MKKTKLHPFGLLLETPAGTEAGSLSREEMLALVAEHKLVLVRGLRDLGAEDLLHFAAADRARDLIHWNFGPLMEMKADPATENYLFSREAVPFHWDGAFHLEPRVLVFHCVEAPRAEFGGQTTFADAEAIWQEASAAHKARWRKIDLTYEEGALRGPDHGADGTASPG